MTGKEWWKNQPSSDTSKESAKQIFKNFKKFILPVIIIAVVAIGFFTSYYTVNDKQQAVVTTFGKVTT